MGNQANYPEFPDSSITNRLGQELVFALGRLNQPRTLGTPAPFYALNQPEVLQGFQISYN